MRVGYQTLGPLSISAVATLTKLESFGREVGIVKTSFALAPLAFYPVVGELLKIFGWRGPFGFIAGVGKHCYARVALIHMRFKNRGKKISTTEARLFEDQYAHLQLQVILIFVHGIYRALLSIQGIT